MHLYFPSIAIRILIVLLLTCNFFNAFSLPNLCTCRNRTCITLVVSALQLYLATISPELRVSHKMWDNDLFLSLYNQASTTDKQEQNVQVTIYRSEPATFPVLFYILSYPGGSKRQLILFPNNSFLLSHNIKQFLCFRNDGLSGQYRMVVKRFMAHSGKFLSGCFANLSHPS